MINWGKVPLASVLPFIFDTFDGGTGASITMTGLALADILVYKGTSMTQRSSTAGFVLLDTDGIDIDLTTGIHGFSIDTGDNTDAGFFVAGSFYTVVVASVTIDAQTVSFVAGTFWLGPTLTVAGVDEVDVTHWLGTACATPTVNGVPEVDLTHVAGATTNVAALATNVDAILTDTETTLNTHLTDIKGGTFSGATDSLEAIRDRGDAAWTTGAGGSDRLLMVDTTIATLASQTSFTLTAGSADNNAYLNCTIVIEDASTATQKAVGLISAYTGATKTVTLKYDPAIFTMAATDKVYILAENSLKSTAQNRQLDVTATGAAGIDWGNVENPTTAVDLSATDIQLCDTTTTNTDMRGTNNAALASVCTEARLSELDAATGGKMANQVDVIETDTTSLNDTKIPNTLSLANINAEVVDALATDTYAEPGQGAPAATAALSTKINYIYKFLRNKILTSATEIKVYDDAGTTVDQKSTISDDSTNFTRGEFGSGP